MSPQTRGPEKKRAQRSAVHSAAEGLTQKSKARCGKVPKRVVILSIQLTGYWPPPTTRHGLWFGRSLQRESKRIHRAYFIAGGPQTKRAFGRTRCGESLVALIPQLLSFI
jgi:hypothetical protein